MSRSGVLKPLSSALEPCNTPGFAAESGRPDNESSTHKGGRGRREDRRKTNRRKMRGMGSECTGTFLWSKGKPFTPITGRAGGFIGLSAPGSSVLGMGMTRYSRRRVLRILASLSTALPLFPGLVRAASAPPLDQIHALVGQMLLVGFRGTQAPENSPVARDLQARDKGGVHAAGTVLFDYDMQLHQYGRNVTGPKQLRQLTDQLRLHAPTAPLLAVDQEGGRVQRLKPEQGFPGIPSARDLGAAGKDTSATFQAGQKLGRMLHSAGLNLNFAPVVDVDRNQSSPAIGALGRSYSPDPDITTRHAAAFIRGLREYSILSCLKHFPGHGSAAEDSHAGLPDVTGLWSEVELLPYTTLLPQGMADMVMVAHLFNREWDTRFPASLSRSVVHGMLRTRLGFDGVIVTDDLDMKAVADQYDLEQRILLAVHAGNDLLLFGNNLRYDPDLAPTVRAILLEHILAERISVERIVASLRRVARLKRSLAPC
ncbi:beta-N-acetylhexosaminidase [Paucidesulfovibrio gracilis DSM 16080]|uniref:beta-N-acetylhexosaminidase n=2 Tax=Paucidesulfovibrio TaxID=2910985 RepID=A0A1T4W3C7_9BACT|nr:beta-N-acetylhexosaminidase [Paucidesulfovibrio gracilis DSM 16080]